MAENNERIYRDAMGHMHYPAPHTRGLDDYSKKLNTFMSDETSEKIQWLLNSPKTNKRP